MCLSRKNYTLIVIYQMLIVSWSSESNQRHQSSKESAHEQLAYLIFSPGLDANRSTHESVGIFRGREMAKTFHPFEVGPLYLVRCGFAHFWRSTPVVLSGEKVYGTLAHIDFVHTVPSIEAAEIKVEITMKNS